MKLRDALLGIAASLFLATLFARGSGDQARDQRAASSERHEAHAISAPGAASPTPPRPNAEPDPAQVSMKTAEVQHEATRRSTSPKSRVQPLQPSAAGAAAPTAPAARAEAEPAPRFPLTHDGLARGTASVHREIEQCYAGWLKRDRALAGGLKVHLTIERDSSQPERGKVSVAELLSNDLHHTALEGCVLNAFSELGFEPPEEGKLDVVLPLVFNTETKP